MVNDATYNSLKQQYLQLKKIVDKVNCDYNKLEQILEAYNENKPITDIYIVGENTEHNPVYILLDKNNLFTNQNAAMEEVERRRKDKNV